MPKLKPEFETRPNVCDGDITNAVVGTDEQQAIWRIGTHAEGPNLIINAVAGSGKTFTGVELCKRLPGDMRVAFVAFNKHIAEELKLKLAGHSNVECMTYHGLGFKVLRQRFGFGLKVDQYKVDGILDLLGLYGGWTQSKITYVQSRIRKLVGLAKQVGAWSRDELERLVDHHDLDLTNIEEDVLRLTPLVMERCLKQTKTVDLDDMVWLPKELGLTLKKYDLMLVDEAQDTNLAQQWLALNGSSRLVVIGDPHQAIYGFRGSDSQSMQRMKVELEKTDRGVVELGLSFTRRCPKSHVKLAQRIVPQIQALEDAPDGVVRVASVSDAVQEMRPGDLVVCRVNAPLLQTAYCLLRLGVKAVVRGRDIGEGLRKLIEQSLKLMDDGKKDDVSEMLTMADVVTHKAIERLERKGKSEGRIMAARERLECLLTLAQDCQTVGEVLEVVRKLFDDFDDDGKPKSAVVLGTVHRTKGLEGFRVYVLEPRKIPHPMAKRDWERAQELNLAYVAVTRAKYGEETGKSIGFAGEVKTYPGELVFVGSDCPLFS